jgi:hypothetical protein
MLLTSWLKKNGVESDALTVAGPLTFGVEAGTLPSLHQALPRLGHEVARARRYERPLTIALLASDDAHAPSLITLMLAALVRESVRDTDIVAYAPSLALCIIGLPEARQAGARTAMERVQALCLERLMLPVRSGVAEFPIAGWTLEELIKQAEIDAMRDPALASGSPSARPLTSSSDLVRTNL